MATTTPGFEVDNRSPQFIPVTAVFIALSTIAIILRFWSRAIGHKSQRFWYDDWTALLAWISSTAMSATVIHSANYGLGRHITAVSYASASETYKLIWLMFLFFHLAPALIKFSALFLFARIFSNVRRFRTALWVASGLVTAWLIAFSFTGLFYCVPVQKFWSPTTPGSCIDLWSWFVACGAVDVVLDVVILALPIPMVWNLQCGRGRKASIFFAFVFGYLNLVPSVGRLVTTAKLGEAFTADFTYSGVPDLIWCIMEAPIGVISICIPSWSQLFRRVQQHGLASLFTTRTFAMASSSRQYEVKGHEGGGSTRGGFMRLRWSDTQHRDDEKYIDRTVIEDLKSGSGSSDADSEIIRVRKEVDVTVERLA